jgi:alcohol dehydrogenase YqhD (iron-dependent ADH family)
MQSFTYFNPTRVHMGAGVISKLSEELTAHGIQRVLLVFGRGSIRRNGVYAEVLTQLSNAGVEVVEHGGVQGNPVLSHARSGVALAKEARVDAICGVGGGSVIDEAKAIAAGAASNSDVWDFFSGNASPNQVLPLFTVCTLPATGSEMNGICVLTNEETQEKNALVKPGVLNPTVSFLDPHSTMTLSPVQTAYACTDILSHVMEAYFTAQTEWLPLQDNLMAGVCRATISAMDGILKKPDDYDARATFMWAATMAWSGIVQAGVPGTSMPCHALEMPMSAVYDMAHGAGLSVVIPAWIAQATEGHARRIRSFFKTVFDVDVPGMTDAARILRAYYQRIGSPVTFAGAGVSNPDVAQLVLLAAASFAQRGMTDYTTERIQNIYEACLQ